MSDTFTLAVNWLLGPEIEGEHSNDPADKGGDTWYGLARRWNQDMPWPPTRGQAIQRYRARYWDACRCDELPPVIAVAVFDAAVQHDPDDAARFLQRAIGASVDGDIGPKTLGKAAEADAATLANFLSYRALYYTKLTHDDRSQMRFARGWARRLFLLQQFALGLQEV
jgi:lysozyme family protein